MWNSKIIHGLIQLTYLSFALDSLLKVNIGFKIHFGVLLILGLNFLYFILKGFKFSIKFSTLDFWFILFTLYIFFSGIIKTGTSSLLLFFYFFLALNTYFFINQNFERIEYKTIVRFQKILIVTGIFQICLYWFFDYQINFLDDIGHYFKGSSVSQRVRGFFVEPNWFAIAITFNTFLLIKNNILEFIKQHYYLFAFSIVVMLLNGSIGTLAIFVGTYGYTYLKKNLIMALGLAIIGVFVFTIIINKRAEVKKNKEGIEIFNYYSRLEPLKRVNNYFDKQDIFTRAFGVGFGSWGTVAVENRLSVLVYRKNPSSRDGSELPVFIFELGYIGLIIFLFDWLTLFVKNHKKDYFIYGALLLFLVCFFLYPIFKFLMYMAYYFMIRVMIKKRKHLIHG